MGTVAFTVSGKTSSGNQHGTFGTLAMSDSYATGGDAVTARAAGMGDLSGGLILSGGGLGGYVISYDVANATLQAHEAGADAAALDEVTATTDLSAVVVNFRAYGAG